MNAGRRQDDRQRDDECPDMRAHSVLQPRHRGAMYPDTRPAAHDRINPDSAFPWIYQDYPQSSAVYLSATLFARVARSRRWSC